jgi:hypothetical protein
MTTLLLYVLAVVGGFKSFSLANKAVTYGVALYHALRMKSFEQPIARIEYLLQVLTRQQTRYAAKRKIVSYIPLVNWYFGASYDQILSNIDLKLTTGKLLLKQLEAEAAGAATTSTADQSAPFAPMTLQNVH